MCIFKLICALSLTVNSSLPNSCLIDDVGNHKFIGDYSSSHLKKRGVIKWHNESNEFTYSQHKLSRQIEEAITRQGSHIISQLLAEALNL